MLGANNRIINGPISPFKPLWYYSCPNPSDWCIPHRVMYGLTIRRGQRSLIVVGINLATSAQQTGLVGSLREYNSSYRNGVKICGVIAKKLSSLFHIPSKSHTVCLEKKRFHAVKAVGLINCKILLSRTYNDIYSIFMYYDIFQLFS